jgi:DinB superfamily
MRKVSALFSLALAVAPLAAGGDGRLTDSERAFLVEQLEQTKANMLASIAGLTPAQWRFKAGPDRWSVAECAQHIILAEDFIFAGSQQVLKSPAVPRPEKSNAAMDKGLVAGVTDRSKKLTAPEPLVPTKPFDTPEEAARAFTEKRDRNIAYVKSTEDELRVHVGQSPAGPLDAYQLMLLMAAHSGRHTAQIREVEADPNFPKASALVRSKVELGSPLTVCRKRLPS